MSFSQQCVQKRYETKVLIDTFVLAGFAMVSTKTG
jgi:hypothetical protein